MNFGHRFGIVAALTGGLALGACSTSDVNFRETVGLDQAPPDEFLVVSKAPLVVPPDMNLRPPQPGAAPLNAYDPRAEARTAVTGGQSAPQVTGASAGEQSILARAGANSADPNIRADLLREQGVATKDQSLVDQLATARRDEAETLDPYTEAQRIQTEGTGQTGQASGAPTSILLEDILGGSSSN